MPEKEQNINGIKFAIVQKYSPDRPLAVVKASGEDALEFLQGQFTSDLSGLSDSGSTYGFLLTQKGRVFGDAFLRREDEENWQILSWSLTSGDLVERLESYVIADDVELEDETESWMGWRIGATDESIASLVESTSALVVLDCAPDLNLPWRMAVIPRGEAFGWPEGWEQVAIGKFETARIDAEWPRVPYDLGEGDFPAEGGRHLHAISFTKGCYLGQEVVARLAATGRLRRGLARVGGTGSSPVGEIELLQGDKTVGELRSRSASKDEAGWVGLAMMHQARFDETQPVATAAGRPLEFYGLLSDEVGSGD